MNQWNDKKPDLGKIDNDKLRHMAEIITLTAEKAGLSVCFFIAEEKRGEVNATLGFWEVNDPIMQGFAMACMSAEPFRRNFNIIKDIDLSAPVWMRPVKSLIKKMKAAIS